MRDGGGPVLRFRLLGPTEIVVGDEVRAVGPPRARSLLAYLLLSANRMVPIHELIEALWGGAAPGTARAQIQAEVTRVRRMVQPRVSVVTASGGYRMELAAGLLDVAEFHDLVAASHRYAAGGERPRAAGSLRHALSLWHGSALADVDAAFAEPTRVRLEEQRLLAIEELAEIELELGRQSALLGELTELVARHPLRERLRASLMLALHREGRSSEALGVARGLRALLLEEHGLDPGRRIVEAELRILQDSPSATADPAPRELPQPMPGRPALLPGDPAGFRGRAGQLAELDTLVAAGSGATVVISAVTGAPGVGKTALAVHWALGRRQSFADGQLYLDLRGHALEAPMPPREALTHLVFALGVPSADIPSDLDDLAGLYRTLLTDKRLLVLLDNALDAEQVRPLLPGAGRSVVVITSRDRLSGLIAREGARHLLLDVLAPHEAREVLAAVVGEPRVAAEPDAVGALIERCGRLPLALRIAAAHLHTHPDLTVAGFVDRLAAGDVLGQLAVPGDPATAVRAAFALSYQALPAAAAEMFRLLSRVPGPDVSAEAAAALAGTDLADARSRLATLVEAHLVQEVAPGRHGTHDLLAAYAAEVAGRDSSPSALDSARDRLLRWYVDLAAEAVDRLYPDVVRLAAPSRPAFALPPGLDPMAYLTAEHANLVAAIHAAATAGPLPVAVRLADALRAYLSQRAPRAEWVAVATAALAAATSAGDACGQAAAHLSLAHEAVATSRLSDAQEHYRRALALSTAAGWLDAQAAIHSNLGVLDARSGRLAEAIDHHETSLALHRQARKTTGIAVNLGNLGGVYHRLGRLQDAATVMREALDIHLRADAAGGQAMQHNNLSIIMRELGETGSALRHAEQAVRLYQVLGSAVGEGMALCNLAEAHRQAGRYATALDLARTALELPPLADHQEHQASALLALATIYSAFGDHPSAEQQLSRALPLAQAAGNRETEGEILVGMARTSTAFGRHELAAGQARQAMAIADDIRLGVLRAMSRTALAEALLRLGDNEGAESVARQALRLHEQAAHRSGTRATHELLKQIRSRVGAGQPGEG